MPRLGRRSAALVTASVLAAATTVAVAAPASAVTTQPATAIAQFLTGTAGSTDLASLVGAAATTASGATSAGPNLGPVSGSTLNALPTTLTGGIPLFGNSGVLQLGDANQVASASASGLASAATGGVSNAGAIALGGGGAQGGATLDASSLLAQVPAVASALSQLKVTLSGIASTASQAAGVNGLQSGGYALSGGMLTMTSPVLGNVRPNILSALTPVQSAMNNLGGSSGGLATAFNNIPVVGQVLSALGLSSSNTTASVTSNLAGTVTPLLGTLTSPDHVMSLDLTNGQMVADLAALAGGGLGGQPVNTNVLSTSALSTMSSDVTSLISGLVSTVQSAVTSAINSAPVSFNSQAGNVLGGITGLTSTVSGTLSQVVGGTATTNSTLLLAGLPLPLSQATLLSALSNPINTTVLSGALPTFTSGLPGLSSTPVGSTVAPGLGSIGSVLSMVVNHQSALNGLFTETAVVFDLIPGGSPLASLGLGSSSVGPNTGPVAPTASSLSPTAGMTAGGQPVTVTGTGFVSGATSVSVDGANVPSSAVTVNSATSLTFTSPAHAAGQVPVVVSTPFGAAAPQTFSYVAFAGAPGVSSIFPRSGPATGGRPLSVTGNGFVPGGTSVTIGGTSVAPANVHVVSATQLTFTVPAHAPGNVAVTVSSAGNTLQGPSYAYVGKPTVSSLSVSRVRTAGGDTVTVHGTGFVRSATEINIGGMLLGVGQVSVSSSTSLSFPTPAHAAGAVAVRAVTIGGTSAGKTLTYVRGAARPLRASTISAARGTTSGGDRVFINGNGFVPRLTAVRIGTLTVAPYVLSNSRLWFVTPAHAAGAVPVRVVNGRASVAAPRFAYVKPSAPVSAMPKITAPGNNTSSTVTAPFVGGTGVAGAAITVFADGMQYCKAKVAGNGRWSCANTTPLLPGGHVLAATQAQARHAASPGSHTVRITVR